MAPRPSWILKAPRVVLVVVFPAINFILYLILSLGCTSESLGGVSPVIARSNGPVNIGGTDIQVDLRVGFLGVCFGPVPLSCTTAATVLNPKREADLARSIPIAKGGGNFALAGLALGLQSSFVVLSGLPVLLILIASIIANMIQIYFSVQGMYESHAKAALWARSLDWAAAAGAVVGFSAYQSVVAAAPRLIRVLMAGAMLNVSVGATASNLFGAVVGLTIAGALINTLLTAGDAGFDAYLTGRRMEQQRQGPLGKPAVGAGGYAGEGEGSRMSRVFMRRRPAYEVFP
ncbi:hypothetical protein QBC35DRAFT_458218 [Podospora australis]|uniref:Uncharacterized protein n=1 Tax=Podospora australis TaxID=1536484 RepID=A0AAN7APR7_9PEZI|nr:hypothetical protein QBC35DRAFT_458218 [Podospora australis]